MILLWTGKYILELPGIQSLQTYSTLKWFHDTLDKQILVTLSWHASLIPLFSFWLLAVCKKGGGKPGPFYHVNDVSVYRGGEVPNQKKNKKKKHFAHAFFVSDQEQYVFALWMFETPALGQ